MICYDYILLYFFQLHDATCTPRGRLVKGNPAFSVQYSLRLPLGDGKIATSGTIPGENHSIILMCDPYRKFEHLMRTPPPRKRSESLFIDSFGFLSVENTTDGPPHVGHVIVLSLCLLTCYVGLSRFAWNILYTLPTLLYGVLLQRFCT